MTKIGTCVKGEELLTALPAVIEAGFESVEVYFDSGLKGTDLKELSVKAKEIVGDANTVFSAIGIYIKETLNNAQQSFRRMREL